MPLPQDDIRSDEVREIMGQVPSWLVRWGITVLFVIFLVLIAFSYFFKMPEVLYCKVKIVNPNPPLEILSRTDGKIQSIFVRDNDTVSSGDILLLIESTVNYEDYKLLKKYLDSLKPFVSGYDSVLPQIRFPVDFSLGPVQEDFSAFVKAYRELSTFNQLTYFDERYRSLRNQKKQYNLYYSRLWGQRMILEEEYKLAEQQFQTAQNLYENQAISKNEYVKAKSELLSKKYSFEKIRTELANTKMKMEELEKEMIDLKQNFEENKKRLTLNLLDAYDKLRNAMEEYEYIYLIKSPVNGTVSFTRIWSKNQSLTRNEKVLTIVPKGGDSVIGKALLPVRGSGRVRPGQKVLVKLDNFPYMDYGMLSGKVQHISRVPDEDYYSVDIVFPSGLVTNYGIKLSFNGELSGMGEIITENVRLIEKIFRPILALFYRQKQISAPD